MAKEKIIHKTSVGGQALMEGVMMNGPKGAAISVRHTDGHIITEMSEVKHIKDKVKILGLPFVRGIVNFIESMTVGYKSLMRSVELSGMLDEEEDKEQMSKLDRWLSEHLGPKVFNVLTIFASVIAVVFCVALFFYAPTYLVDLVDEKLLNGAIADFHPLFEGILKIVIVVIYMLVVSQMKDIKRVFMYHGAEHKTIFCYEQGLPLTVDNVKKQRRFHPRCGTSFLILMLIVSILIGFLIPSAQVLGLKQTVVYTLVRAAIKLLLIPLTMGIGYELLKLAGRYDNIFTRIISAPGMWLQRITVREPTDDMIECAIKAFVAVLPEEEKAKALTEETPVAEEKTDAE